MKNSHEAETPELWARTENGAPCTLLFPLPPDQKDRPGARGQPDASDLGPQGRGSAVRRDRSLEGRCVDPHRPQVRVRPFPPHLRGRGCGRSCVTRGGRDWRGSGGGERGREEAPGIKRHPRNRRKVSVELYITDKGQNTDSVRQELKLRP